MQQYHLVFCFFLKGHSSHSVTEQVVQKLFRILFLDQTLKRKQLLQWGSKAEQTEFGGALGLDQTVSVHFCFK